MPQLLVIALACYVTGSAGYLAYLFLHREDYYKYGHAFFTAGLLAHSMVLVTEFVVSGMLPVENMRETLSFLAWSLALVFVVFQVRFSLKVLGVVVGPLASALLVAGLAFPSTPYAQPEILKSVWVFFHILAVFLGDAAFVLAGAVGGAYLLQERAIKKKQHGFVYRRLPSLEILDRMGYALVAFGFPLLTIGIIAGFVYAQSVTGRWWSWDPKEVWSVVTWLLYAALLHERLAVGWRGRRTAIMALVGVFVLLFTFLGVNLLLSGYHGQFTRF